MESIKIDIGGDKFSFNAEDKDLLVKSGDLLNRNLNSLYEYYGKNSDYKRVVVLAALNSISEILEDLNKKENNINILKTEIELTNEILNRAIFSTETEKVI